MPTLITVFEVDSVYYIAGNALQQRIEEDGRHAWNGPKGALFRERMGLKQAHANANLWLLPRCSTVVYCGAIMDSHNLVSRSGLKRKAHRTKTRRSPRTSVTFPPEIYKVLEDLARKKKVSVAWVVRDAAEKYIADQWPLFAKGGA